MLWNFFMFNFMLMMALNNDVDEGKIERISLFKFGSLHLYKDTGLDNFRLTLFFIVCNFYHKVR